jgi:hypothetical protein
MQYPVAGQPQMGYPPFMMPNVFYVSPYMPQVQPWQPVVEQPAPMNYSQQPTEVWFVTL